MKDRKVAWRKIIYDEDFLDFYFRRSDLEDNEFYVRMLSRYGFGRSIITSLFMAMSDYINQIGGFDCDDFLDLVVENPDFYH